MSTANMETNMQTMKEFDFYLGNIMVKLHNEIKKQYINVKKNRKTAFDTISIGVQYPEPVYRSLPELGIISEILKNIYFDSTKTDYIESSNEKYVMGYANVNEYMMQKINAKFAGNIAVKYVNMHYCCGWDFVAHVKILTDSYN